MSGGYFDYDEYKILNIKDEIKAAMKDGNSYFNEDTVEMFTKATELLNVCYALVHRIDWLLSGDDGEETFHERLLDDLEELKKDED